MNSYSGRFSQGSGTLKLEQILGGGFYRFPDIFQPGFVMCISFFGFSVSKDTSSVS